jgi:hypothetical protein
VLCGLDRVYATTPMPSSMPRRDCVQRTIYIPSVLSTGLFLVQGANERGLYPRFELTPFGDFGLRGEDLCVSALLADVAHLGHRLGIHVPGALINRDFRSTRFISGGAPPLGEPTPSLSGRPPLAILTS